MYMRSLNIALITNMLDHVQVEINIGYLQTRHGLLKKLRW